MYIPSSFALTDQGGILNVLRDESFGAFVSEGLDGQLFVSHLPFLVNDDLTLLRTHVARANTHWRAIEERSDEVLVIVQGPHRHISGLWYDDPKQVGTWNYAVVHLRAKARIMQDSAELLRLLSDLNATFDGPTGVEQLESMDPHHRDNLMKAIVGIELNILSVEAKVKMSQNRTAEQRAKVLEALDGKSDAAAKQVAGMIRKWNERE